MLISKVNYELHTLQVLDLERTRRNDDFGNKVGVSTVSWTIATLAHLKTTGTHFYLYSIVVSIGTTTLPSSRER